MEFFFTKGKFFSYLFYAFDLKLRKIVNENVFQGILMDLHSHCAKVQKYEQGKIGLQFFDMWY